MFKPVAGSLFGQFGGIARHQPVFCLALKLWITQKHRQHYRGAGKHVISRDIGRLAVAGQITKAAQRTRDGLTEAGFVGAARRRWYRVAIGMEKSVLAAIQPGNRPFEFLVIKFHLRGKGGRDQQPLVTRGIFQKICQPARIMQRALFGHLLIAVQQLRRTFPADFHTGEQIGLGSGHAVQGGGAKLWIGAENLGIGAEGHGRAAAVRGGANLGKLALRHAA